MLRKGIFILFVYMFSLSASEFSEALPWTKSFLEIRCDGALQQYGMKWKNGVHHHENDMLLRISGSPLVDWELALGFQGRSERTKKGFLQINKQFFSDLLGDIAAASIVASASVASQYRANNPTFFEMGQKASEIGLSCGRHLFIGKTFYTQLYGNIFEGVGSGHGQWTRAEIGVVQLLNRQHTFSLIYQWLRGFGTSRLYRGMGSIRITSHGGSILYGYKWDNGFLAKLSYGYKNLSRRGFSHASFVSATLSIPIQL